MGPLRVIYVCKAVDETHPTVAVQVRWIRALAAKPQIDHVHVLAARRGRADLPANVTVEAFGGPSWPKTIARFCAKAIRTRRSDVDFFFVVQGGPYPALLLPLKLGLRRPLYQWKAHPAVSPRMRFYARVCDDLIFTPTPESFPMELDKVRVVGHGIDTNLFRPSDGPRTGDLVVVGRIAPGKRLEWAIRAVAECRDRFGLELTLDVVGSCYAKDEPYRRQLDELVSELELADAVRFRGVVEHQDLPDLLTRYRTSINFSKTAFDKAAGEAMAAGVPVVTTNRCTVEMLPYDLRASLSAPEEDVTRQADVIHDVALWSDARRAEVGHRLRQNVVRHHSLDSFFDKILAEIGGHRQLTG